MGSTEKTDLASKMSIKLLRKQSPLGDFKLLLNVMLANLSRLAGDARDRKTGS